MRPYENIEIIEDEPEWDDRDNILITYYAIDTNTGQQLDSITLENPSDGILARYCRKHGWNVGYDDTVVCPTCRREEMGMGTRTERRETPRPRGRRDRRRRDRPGYRPNPRNTGARVEPDMEMIEIGDILRHKEYGTIVKIEDVMQQDGDEGYRVSVLTDQGIFEAFMPFRDLKDYDIVEKANPGNTGARVRASTPEEKEALDTVIGSNVFTRDFLDEWEIRENHWSGNTEEEYERDYEEAKSLRREWNAEGYRTKIKTTTFPNLGGGYLITLAGVKRKGQNNPRLDEYL